MNADLFAALRSCARVYRARQLMRFGPGDWTKYFESPYSRLPFSFCRDDFPTDEVRRPILVWPEPSAMQGHWE